MIHNMGGYELLGGGQRSPNASSVPAGLNSSDEKPESLDSLSTNVTNPHRQSGITGDTGVWGNCYRLKKTFQEEHTDQRKSKTSKIHRR